MASISVFVVKFVQIKSQGRSPILGKNAVFRRIVICDRITMVDRIATVDQTTILGRMVALIMKLRNERYRREIWKDVKQGERREVDRVYSD